MEISHWDPLSLTVLRREISMMWHLLLSRMICKMKFARVRQVRKNFKQVPGVFNLNVIDLMQRLSAVKVFVFQCKEFF